MLLILEKKRQKHEIKYFLSSSVCLDYCKNFFPIDKLISKQTLVKAKGI